jgi:hypothetical protein
MVGGNVCSTGWKPQSSLRLFTPQGVSNSSSCQFGLSGEVANTSGISRPSETMYMVL